MRIRTGYLYHIKNKIKKYKVCYTILIREVLGKDVAILLQNAFPTLEKYIDLFFTDIDKLKNELLEENVIKN